MGHDCFINIFYEGKKTGRDKCSTGSIFFKKKFVWMLNGLLKNASKGVIILFYNLKMKKKLKIKFPFFFFS